MAHTSDTTEHESGHGHDDHDHGHGGGQSLGFETIAENSAADGLLKMLAGFTFLGLLVFVGIMVSTWLHHEEHPAAETQTAPQGSPSSVTPGGSHGNAEHP